MQMRNVKTRRREILKECRELAAKTSQYASMQLKTNAELVLLFLKGGG